MKNSFVLAICMALMVFMADSAFAANANQADVSQADAGHAAVAIASATAAAPKPAARNPLWAAPVDPARNLYRITPMLYRSEQLGAGDAALIQSLGIRTIISLRAHHSDESLLKLPGITLIRVPMNTWNIGDKQIVAALRAIDQAMPRGPVLIHCQHGADRTGAVSAMYRMVVQHWTREQALDELRNGGYGFHGIWRNIPNYLKRADVQAVQRKLGRNE